MQRRFAAAYPPLAQGTNERRQTVNPQLVQPWGSPKLTVNPRRCPTPLPPTSTRRYRRCPKSSTIFRATSGHRSTSCHRAGQSWEPPIARKRRNPIA